jgi:hypothetical protein
VVFELHRHDSWYQIEYMSQTASFVTDYLFPGSLVACGCLGLAVVNLLAQGSRGGARWHRPALRARAAPPASPVRRPPSRLSPVASALDEARPHAVALRPVARPTRHRLVFERRRTRVADAERERLRIFLAAARPGPAEQVVVLQHGPRRAARRRVARVMALLRTLGMPTAQLAGPELAADPDDSSPGPGAVTIVIRKR